MPEWFYSRFVVGSKINAKTRSHRAKFKSLGFMDRTGFSGLGIVDKAVHETDKSKI
jgi:hypothetical protein